MDYTKSFRSSAKVEIEFQEDDGTFTKLQTLIDQPLINNTFTLFTPMKNGAYYPARKGRSVKVTFLHAENENSDKSPYSFKAKITSRNLVDGISILSLSKVSNPKKSQRRESFRLSFVENLEYLYNDEKYTLLTKDISSTGFKALVEIPIQVGSEITLILPLKSETIKIDCEIIYSQKVTDSIIKTEIRGNFITSNDLIKKKITKYLLEKQSEEVRSSLDSDGYSKLFKLINGDQINNKRSGEDFNLRMIKYLSLISWLNLMFLVASYLEARPRNSFGVERFFGIYMGSQWNLGTLNIFLIFAVIQLSLTAYGLMINSTRMKREGDKYSASLIINLVISLISIFTYIIITNFIINSN